MKESKKSLTQVVITWRPLIVRIVGVACVVSVIVSLLLPRWYTGRATILPPQEGEGGPSLLQMLG